MTNAPVSPSPVAPKPTRRNNVKLMLAGLGLVLFITLVVALMPDFKPHIGDVIVGHLNAAKQVDRVGFFTKDDRLIVCNAEVENIPDGYQMRSRWVAQDVPGGPPNEEISLRTTPLKAKEHTFQVKLESPNSFPPGIYRLELYLEPVNAKRIEPTKTFQFQVK